MKKFIIALVISFLMTMTVYASENKNKFIDTDVTISLNNYVPNIEGTLSCAEGKTVVINILNETDNTVIANETITAGDGEYTLSYRLPSLVSSKDYIITITANDGTEKLMLLSVEIDSSIILVSIDGTVDLADGVTIDTSVQSVNTGLIDKSTTITQDKNLSFTIPNLAANATFHLSATGYKTVQPEIPPAGKITASATVNGENVTVSGAIGSGEGAQVTLLVVDSNGKIAYVNQVPSGDKGVYSIPFLLPDNAISGTYPVKVGGTDVNTPATTSFYYTSSGTTEPIEPEKPDIPENGIYIGSDDFTNKSFYWVFKNDSNVGYLNDNKVYFIQDGTENLVIENIYAMFMIKYGNYLFYSDMNDSGKLYRYNISTNTKEKITEDSAAWLYEKDGYIYYKNLSDLGSLYRISSDTEYTVTGEKAN